MIAAGSSVDDTLRLARAAGVARLDALLILGHCLGHGRTWLVAHGDHRLSGDQARAASHALEQRAQGVPLAYLVGQREFHGLMLRVTPDVLDPRPDTETLVDWALNILESAPHHGSVIDLGTGSGAIALALKSQAPGWDVHASDASSAALAVARGNAQSLDLDITFHEGAWWQPLATRRFDLVVSNPPYIAEHDPHLAALRHEPMSALVSGPEGLDDLRVIAAGAKAHLHPWGWLLLEHGHDQAQAVAELMQQAGFVDIQHRSDLAGTVRCTGGRLAG